MKAQYAILRFAKYKGPEISNIEAHNERTKEKYASNPDVDTSRSHLNFHLVTPQRKYRAEAEKQIAKAGWPHAVGQCAGGGGAGDGQSGVFQRQEAQRDQSLFC